MPNLAAREHTRNIVPVVEETLATAKLTPNDLDLIAVTQGPGLMPALLVGVTAAKALAFTWSKPLMGIQHIEGHIYANLLEENTELQFPLLALVVSGGHTELVLMRDHFQYEVLGETQDDAAGEAFDKVARMIGLPYPGGPEIAKRADQFRERGAARQFPHLNFPRPMIQSPDYKFSFSGLKTAVLYALKKESPEILTDENFISEVSVEFQTAVVDVLVAKTKKALREYSPKTLVIAGGVSANASLRERLHTLATDFPETQFLVPPFCYSLDNAAMIGAAALMRHKHLSREQKDDLKTNSFTLEPDANLTLQNLV